jgi:putative ABC transport system permease protein
MPISGVRTMNEVLRETVAERRFTLAMTGLFAALALLLAAIGLYGVMAYLVHQRSHEIGIRRALGARPGQILSLVVGQGLKLTGLGVALGLAGALATTRWLSSQLFGVSSTDPLTFLSIPLLLAAVALLACWLPARRAARVDPMTALRTE